MGGQAGHSAQEVASCIGGGWGGLGVLVHRRNRARPPAPGRTAWGRSAKTCSQLAKESGETPIRYRDTPLSADETHEAAWPAYTPNQDKICGASFCGLRDIGPGRSEKHCEDIGGKSAVVSAVLSRASALAGVSECRAAAAAAACNSVRDQHCARARPRAGLKWQGRARRGRPAGTPRVLKHRVLF